jgi:hypothetical protein
MDSTVVALTNDGNIAIFECRTSTDLLVTHLQTRSPAGGSVAMRGGDVRVANGKSTNLDDSWMRSDPRKDDFAWNHSHGLTPMNNAIFQVWLDFYGITYDQVRRADLSRDKEVVGVHTDLDATLFVRTNEERFCKITIRGQTIKKAILRRAYTWMKDGKRKRYGHDIPLPIGTTVDLDEIDTNPKAGADIRIVRDKMFSDWLRVEVMNGAAACIFKYGSW